MIEWWTLRVYDIKSDSKSYRSYCAISEYNLQEDKQAYIFSQLIKNSTFHLCI